MTTDWARVGSIDPVSVALLPQWLAEIAPIVPTLHAHQMTRFVPPHGQGRHSAVLVLFGSDRDLLLIRRASSMRSHAGQPAFPGGAIDELDDGVADAALREAQEETGLDPTGVVVFGSLPDVWLPVSDNVVTPVLGWWQRESYVWAQDPAEVASVHRIAIAKFVDPANRFRVLHPTGFMGPAFEVEGLTVWGFTGGIIAGLLDHFGWAVPWNENRIVPLPPTTPDP